MADDSIARSMGRRLLRRADVTGRIAVPAVPAMLEDYVEMLDSIFLGIGVEFTDEEIDALRAALDSQLKRAFEESPRSEIVITYSSPLGLVVNYEIHAHWSSVGSTYDNWTSTRQPPYFGTEPDARVLALSVATAEPADCAVLDLGAGTGRNALILARRGHPVDAVELAPKFADTLREEAQRDSLPIRVVEGDILSSDLDLRRDYGLIILSEVTSDFRSVDDLRTVFMLAANHLAPGGEFVLSAFVARDDYTPDAAALQWGQQCYSSMFTRAQITAAIAGLPLELISDESVYEFEKAHLPAVAWPPTSWYEGWVTGNDVYDLAREETPIQMRWLVYRRNL